MTTWYDNINWVALKNVGSSEIPAFGVFMVVGSEKLNNQWILHVEQVDDTKNPVFGFNGEIPVAANKYGQGTLDVIAFAAYTTGDGTPAIGDVWGPKDGESKLKKHYLGVQVIAVDAENELVMVSRNPTLVLIGKTDSTVSAASTGAVSIWNGTLGSESDTNLNVTGYNRGDEIDSGKWVELRFRGGGWEMVPLECN